MKSRRSQSFFSAVALLFLFICTLQSGCAMCCGPYDEAYAGVGGKWQRDDPFHGRVGSPFSSPNAHFAMGAADETINESEIEIIE